MATNPMALVAALNDLGGDVMRNVQTGTPLDSDMICDRLDHVKRIVGAATGEELEAAVKAFRASGGGGAGP